MDVLVSICCITYNHGPFIRQCLDGFMMQKTDFAFEVLIHDDASTDGTAEIIKEYEARYPDVIKPIYEDENQWVKGSRGSAVFNFPRARGKYIALCEGDDYWIDSSKLQKQVDVLEDSPDLVMCSHFRKRYLQNSKEFLFNEELRLVEYNLNNLIIGEWHYQPLTVMFRKNALDDYRGRYAINTDVILFYYLLKRGNGLCLPEVMAVYREHNGGVWSLVNQDQKWKHEFMARLELCKIEDSYDAARFIYNQMTKNISRMWLIKNYRILLKSSYYICKHLPFKYMLKLICSKFVANRPLEVLLK